MSMVVSHSPVWTSQFVNDLNFDLIFMYIATVTYDMFYLYDTTFIMPGTVMALESLTLTPCTKGEMCKSPIGVYTSVYVYLY